ncbi:MAG: hypothetical protein JXR23_05205 [Pontiellaceae bacterium]|nr:hypothetical protein [Pontiellaceae bacterium]
MNELIQRFVGFFVVGLIPFWVVVTVVESFKNEALFVGVAVCMLVWLAYANAWSKRAASILNSERISICEAWSKSRVFLNTDILTKLAFIPVIGCIFDSWINRNNPSHRDDREIKLEAEDE